MAHAEGPESDGWDRIMQAPVVSVILPVHNGERFLEAAIRSVLEQDACPIELIVIDDGSTDGSIELARAIAPDACLVRQENAGPAAARNRGLAEARGEYLAFIDADDMWPANTLGRQLDVLLNDATADMTLGLTRSILPDGTFSEPRFYLQLGCGLYRKRAFERVGKLDESLRFSEDVDWFTRVREEGLHLEITDNVTLHYRLHEDNVTRGTNVFDLGYLQLVKRSLDRRRARAGTESVELPPL